MLRDVVRSFLKPRTPPPKIVKLGALSSQLAAVIASAPPLDASTGAALDVVRANVGQNTDASPNPIYLTVAQHFFSASSSSQKLRRLVALVKWSDAKSILEIGTGYGVSAIAMAKAQREPNLTTIEGSEPQITIAQREVAAAIPGGGVRLIAGNKNKVIPSLVRDGHCFDFVFHDGGHNGDGYVRDYERLMPMLPVETVLVIDDIHWDETPERRKRTAGSQRSCYEGWLDVVQDSRVSAALESGNLGILILGRSQVPN